MYDIVELNKKLVTDLREIAIKLNIEKADKLKKEELVYKILDQQAISPISNAENKKPERQETSDNRQKKPNKEKQRE